MKLGTISWGGTILVRSKSSVALLGPHTAEELSSYSADINPHSALNIANCS
jgi:hypothetical protein